MLPPPQHTCLGFDPGPTNCQAQVDGIYMIVLEVSAVSQTVDSGSGLQCRCIQNVEKSRDPIHFRMWTVDHNTVGNKTRGHIEYTDLLLLLLLPWDCHNSRTECVDRLPWVVWVVGGSSTGCAANKSSARVVSASVTAAYILLSLSSSTAAAVVSRRGLLGSEPLAETAVSVDYPALSPGYDHNSTTMDCVSGMVAQTEVSNVDPGTAYLWLRSESHFE